MAVVVDVAAAVVVAVAVACELKYELLEVGVGDVER